MYRVVNLYDPPKDVADMIRSGGQDLIAYVGPLGRGEWQFSPFASPFSLSRHTLENALWLYRGYVLDSPELMALLPTLTAERSWRAGVATAPSNQERHGPVTRKCCAICWTNCSIRMASLG